MNIAKIDISLFVPLLFSTILAPMLLKANDEDVYPKVRKSYVPRDWTPSASKVYYFMSYNLPLKEMTIKEKLAVMESLWEDLTRTPKPLNLLLGTKESLMSAANDSTKDNLNSSIGKQPKPHS